MLGECKMDHKSNRQSSANTFGRALKTILVWFCFFFISLILLSLCVVDEVKFGIWIFVVLLFCTIKLTKKINQKGSPKTQPTTSPSFAKSSPTTAHFCRNCGAPLTSANTCPKCGILTSSPGSPSPSSNSSAQKYQKSASPANSVSKKETKSNHSGTQKRCEKCGAILQQGASFCRECGAPASFCDDCGVPTLTPNTTFESEENTSTYKNIFLGTFNLSKDGKYYEKKLEFLNQTIIARFPNDDMLRMEDSLQTMRALQLDDANWDSQLHEALGEYLSTEENDNPTLVALTALPYGQFRFYFHNEAKRTFCISGSLSQGIQDLDFENEL